VTPIQPVNLASFAVRLAVDTDGRRGAFPGEAPTKKYGSSREVHIADASCAPMRRAVRPSGEYTGAERGHAFGKQQCNCPGIYHSVYHRQCTADVSWPDRRDDHIDSWLRPVFLAPFRYLFYCDAASGI